MFRRILNRLLAGPEFNARQWSNAELARVGPAFAGSVVNVSAGNDADKQGRRYRDYFPAASSYAVSNYGGLVGLDGEFVLDLEIEQLPGHLVGAFDLVLSHTVLEHVFDLHTAVRNLTTMSRDAVVTVVPFLQSFHTGPGYGDYWRFTPTAVSRLFRRHGFETVYVSWNDDSIGNIYVMHVCARNVERWARLTALQPHPGFGPGTVRNRRFFGDGALQKARIDLRTDL